MKEAVLCGNRICDGVARLRDRFDRLSGQCVRFLRGFLGSDALQQIGQVPIGQTVVTRKLIGDFVVVNDGSESSELIGVQHAIMVHIEILVPQGLVIAVLLFLLEVSKEVEVHEGELEIVAGPESMRHGALEVRADSLLDLREHSFIDEMGHVRGDVPLGIAEETDEKHVGVDEGVVVCVGKAARR